MDFKKIQNRINSNCQSGIDELKKERRKLKKLRNIITEIKKKNAKHVNKLMLSLKIVLN